MTAAPKGNQNAVGNPGGGRKSAYQEKADAEMLHEMFFGKHTEEEIRTILKRGKYSIKDVLVSKAFNGDMRAIIEIFKKVFPDSKRLAIEAEYEPVKPILSILVNHPDKPTQDSKDEEWKSEKSTQEST